MIRVMIMMAPAAAAPGPPAAGARPGGPTGNPGAAAGEVTPASLVTGPGRAVAVTRRRPP